MFEVDGDEDARILEICGFLFEVEVSCIVESVSTSWEEDDVSSDEEEDMEESDAVEELLYRVSLFSCCSLRSCRG